MFKKCNTDISYRFFLVACLTEARLKLNWPYTITYIRMNSHICDWSPSLRVALDWRRKGIDRQPEVRKDGHVPRGHWVAVPKALVVSLMRD